ncbi:MAG: cupin domain-containing protein [Bacteroidetes bacterium]|nr:cupin domain-containing protein [Bacteroidota bacterium]
MFIADLSTSSEFIAGDNTILRELLHPDKAPLELRYSLAHATVKPGETSYEHSLTTSEVYYILQGKGIMHIGAESQEVIPGQAIYIPPKAWQCIHNPGPGDLTFICIVDPAWRKEDEVVR